MSTSGTVTKRAAPSGEQPSKPQSKKRYLNDDRAWGQCRVTRRQYPHPRMSFSHTLLFVCAVPDMMFGFGDVETPLQSTVDTVEDLVTSYVQTLVKKAQDGRASGSRTPLTEQDLLMQVRKDPPKYYRATELLEKWDEIKKAKANNLEIDGTVL